MGTTKQNATIFSNDPQQPAVKITIGGVIKPYIVVQPGPRVIFSGYYGDQLAEQLRIISSIDEPLVITEVFSTIDDKIEYTLKTEKKDKEYSLGIKTRGGMEETFRGKIVLKTASQKKPEILVTVMGTLKKEVKVTPEYLYFGIIDTSKEKIDGTRLRRTAVISQFQSADLTVKKIETSKDWITAQANTDQEGKQYTITVNLNKDRLPKGKFRETVSVHTQCGERADVATIIVEGKVM